MKIMPFFFCKLPSLKFNCAEQNKNVLIWRLDVYECSSLVENHLGILHSSPPLKALTMTSITHNDCFYIKNFYTAGNPATRFWGSNPNSSCTAKHMLSCCRFWILEPLHKRYPQVIVMLLKTICHYRLCTNSPCSYIYWSIIGLCGAPYSPWNFLSFYHNKKHEGEPFVWTCL